MSSYPNISVDQLFQQYQTFLLDAFGVLVDKNGPLPGVVDLVDRLNREQRPYLILTNSASRLPETMARDYQHIGLELSVENILSSGMLLTSWFEQQGLQGSRCLVLGPEDSVEYVRRAGGERVEFSDTVDAEVVVVADQKGFDFLEGMNQTLSMLLRRLDKGEKTHLVLCNPDIIFPMTEGQYGFTSGGVAAMLEAILTERYPGSGYRFDRLGKPHLPVFEEAFRRVGSDRAVMVGDQVATDILGANQAGIDSVLVGTGLYRTPDSNAVATPTWFMPSIGGEL